MIPSFGRGRGRRQVLQLGNSNSNSSYLARYGCMSVQEEGTATDRRGKPNQEKAGLSALVGAYEDSDSDAEEPCQGETKTMTPPNITLPMETQVKCQQEGQGQAIDTEVASFLAEINAISTDSPEVDNIDIPLPPGSFIPRDKTLEVMERNRELAMEEDVRSEPRPVKKTNNYSMFVKGGKERLGNKGGNYSQFVKGGTEVLKTDKLGDGFQEEEFELPEAPTTVWQQCQDENTKYIYYWNFVTNEVTWNIPADYTRYLLLQKEYEEKLARIPEDVRKRLEAKKLAQSKQEETAVAATSSQPEKSDTPAPQPSAESSSTTSTLPAPASKSDSPGLDSSEAKPKKSKKAVDPVLPDSQDISSSEHVKEEKVEKKKLSVSEVDSFVSELLEVVPSNKAIKEESKPQNGMALDQSDDIDFDIDDIDAALEMALERKTATVKKPDDDPKESKHSKSRKHEKKEKRRDKHRSDSHHKSESSRYREKTESRSKSDSRHKRSSHRDTEEKEVKREVTESQPKKARLVAAYDDDSEEEASTTTTVNTSMSTSMSTSTSTSTSTSASTSTSTSTSTSVTSVKPPESVPSTSKQEVKLEDYAKEEPKVRTVPHLIQIKDEVEDAASIALGKLEFLEVTKKGLSKLQVLLLELQTRFRDWQDGGLDTEFFLCRLKEANRQLEQYEQSAVPSGYSCHWDRNFRRYFYTSELTGDSQWEYPEPSVSTTTTSTTPTADQSEVSSSKEPAIPAGDPPSPKPIPPPPPPDEEEEEAEGIVQEYGPHLPPTTSVTNTTPTESAEDLASLIDGEPMPPDSSEETVTEETAKPPEPDNSEQTADAPPVFPGEPPPPGTEVLFGLPPPPPPSEPYPGVDDATYSVDHDSPDDADMDVDDPDSPNSGEAEGAVSSSDYRLSNTIQASSSDITTASLHTSEAVESAPVIYRPPQLNVTASSSSSSTSALSSFQAVHPVISAQPMISTQASEPVSQSSSAVDMFADPRSEEISSTSVAEIPQPPLPIQPPEPEKSQKKKKKKDKSITSSSLSLKKKNVSSLVQKWQQVKEQVAEEEKVNEERQMAIRQKLEEWKREQAHS